MLLAASAALMTLATITHLIAIPEAVLGLAATFAAAFAVNIILRHSDADSPTSLRRLFGLFFVANVLWVIPLTAGSASSFIAGNTTSSANEFIFGAFLAWAFELIVINGIFVVSTLKSLTISAIHPLAILLITAESGRVWTSAYPGLAGLIVLTLAAIFLLRLGAFRTSRGLSSLETLQAFVKTWVVQRPGELEKFFTLYSTKHDITTDVLVTDIGEKRVVLILPGVHPGPFYPVGSYNLSELLYRKLQERGILSLVLHGTGGHERNIPRNEITAKYAENISRFVSESIVKDKLMMKGPLVTTVGHTTVTTVSFVDHILAFISNSPFDSDDIDSDMASEALGAATEMGLRLSLVDAHSSIGGAPSPPIAIKKNDWTRIFKSTLAHAKQEFSAGYAHSSEINFRHGQDISDGGIGVLVLATAGYRGALVAVDSNNAVAGLRERISAELKMSEIHLIELCTSDTHNLAARRVIERGYFALGESTTPETIIQTVRSLAEKAEERVTSCSSRVERIHTELPLVGHESLDDFAKLTKDATSLAKTFTRIVLPVAFALATVMLIY